MPPGVPRCETVIGRPPADVPITCSPRKSAGRVLVVGLLVEGVLLVVLVDVVVPTTPVLVALVTVAAFVPTPAGPAPPPEVPAT